MYCECAYLRHARRLLGYLRPHLGSLVAAAATMLLVTVIHLARPLLLRELIDTALPRRDLALAAQLGIGFVAALAVGAVALYGRALLLARVGTSVMAALKEAVFGHLVGLGLAFFDKNAPGKLISRAENDIEQMRGLVSSAAAQLVANALLLVAIAALIAWQEPPLGRWLIGALVIGCSAVALFAGVIRRMWREIRERDAEMAARLTEFVQGVSLLRLFNKEEEAVQRVVAATADRITIESRAGFYESVLFYGGFTFVAEIGCTVLLLYYSTGEIFAGRMSVGALVMYIELMRRFFTPLRDLAEVLMQVQSGLAATGRVFALLDLEPEQTLSRTSAVADPDTAVAVPLDRTRAARRPQGEREAHDGRMSAERHGGRAVADEAFALQVDGGQGVRSGSVTPGGVGRGGAPPSPAMCPVSPSSVATSHEFTGGFREIAFADVGFAYGDTPVLQDLSFTVRRGQHVAIVGASGSGKSTCINLLQRFYEPTAGAITIDGVDLRAIPVDAWRRHVALVLQDIHLFPGTVLENLRAFDPGVPEGRVIAAARELGAHTFIERLPDGYRTVLAERGANLSLGERQLLCYVRALVRNPRLLILDEATSAVDARTERQLQEAMARLMRGRTAVIIAHRLTTVVGASRILVLDQGRLAQAGTHDELVRQSGHYRELAQLQGLVAGGRQRCRRRSSLRPAVQAA